MKRMLSWWRGLIALVVVVAFALTMAWLLRGARQGPAVGQPEPPPPERKPAPSGTLPASLVVAPTIILSPTGDVTATATPVAQETVRILYAVQPSRGAATLWTLDLAPGNKVLASSELTTSPIPVEGLHLYEISISPDGRYAALNLRGRAEDLDVEVWTVDLASGAVTQLPELRQSGLVFMDWIPGTNKLLTTDLNGAVVAFMTPDGSDVKELSHHFFQDGAASPDGKEFVLSALEETTFWFMNVDGNLIEKIPIPDKEWPGSGGPPFGLAWSPDGTKLAYVDQFVVETDRGLVDSGMKQVRVMNLDGSNLRYLSSQDTQNLFPAWSPDSTAVIYIHGESKEVFRWDGSGDPALWNSSLWIAQVETGQYDELVSSEGQACWSPHWLRNGSGLVFISNRTGKSAIWVVSRDGSGLQQLTNQGDVVALDIFR